MRRSILASAAALALAVVSTAYAVEDNSPSGLYNPVSGLFSGGPEVAVTENFETFTLGNPVQSGWTTNGTNAGTAFQVVNTTPLQGAQSVRWTNNTASAVHRYISPVQAPGDGYQGATFRVDTLSATTSQGIETANSTATISGRILLAGDGDIDVLQAVGGVGVFTDIGNWAVGVPVELGIESLSSGVQRVYINKSLAFTGSDIQFAITGVYAAPISVRAQAFGGAAVAGAFTVDNFNTVVPEPASLSVLALAGAMVLRRRRA